MPPSPFPSCPDAMTLGEIAEGLKTPSEGLLEHLADCPACQIALSEADEPRPLDPAAVKATKAAMARLEEPTPRRRWPPLAALAAALLLALAFPLARAPRTAASPGPGGASKTQGGTAEGSAAFPPFQRMGPDGLLKTDDDEAREALGRSCSLTLRRGSAARADRPGEVTLLQGALWFEDPGEPFLLKAGGGRIGVEEGTFLLERLPTPAAGAWLAEALADGPEEFRLVVLAGSAEILGGDAQALQVGPGQEIVLSSAGFQGPMTAPSLPWRGDQGWQSPEHAPSRLGEGAHALAPAGLGDAYVWEALVRRANRSAGAAVLFTAGARGWRVPLGKPLEQEGWLRVRVEVLGGWVRLRAGSYDLLCQPAADLDRSGFQEDDRVCGLRVWGGDMELRDARWRRLP